MEKIQVHYDGGFPNLCSGSLTVLIGKTEWEFPSFCLSSGGSVSFTPEWDEMVGRGPWSVSDWPPGFPEDMKGAVTDAINDSIPYGCCGGCV